MRTWISHRLRPLLAATAVLGLAWAGWSQREAIASFDWSIDRGLLVLAVALFAVAPLLQGLTFALGLRRVGARPPSLAALRRAAPKASPRGSSPGAAQPRAVVLRGGELPRTVLTFAAPGRKSQHACAKRGR